MPSARLESWETEMNDVIPALDGREAGGRSLESLIAVKNPKIV
jgi:hypothetical protein